MAIIPKPFTRVRLLFVAACVAAFAFVTSCSVVQPSYWSNSFVVHVVSDGCDFLPEHEPILVHQASQGGIGKRTVVEHLSFRHLNECGEASASDDAVWEGKYLQVWVTQDAWFNLDQPISVQLGYNTDSGNVYSISEHGRMRIDHSHVFVGAFDVHDGDARYLPPRVVPWARDMLTDRQHCETDSGMNNCGAEWENADLTTFEVITER